MYELRLKPKLNAYSYSKLSDMSKKIIIDANFSNETRVALLNNNNLEDIECEAVNKFLRKGNIYLAKVTWIESSLQAAFINYGTDKGGFLPFNEIHPDYYNIPISDQQALGKNLKEITLPDITTKDVDSVEEKPAITNYNPIIDNDEIDLQAIENLIDDKVQPDFDLDANEADLEMVTTQSELISSKQYKIHEVIKKGQILLVQVTKEERGNKGASFTTYISLAGKYCVLMPNKALQSGVSRKISNVTERKRLKKIIDDLVPDQDKKSSSLILRTAGAGRTTLEVKKDYDYLVRLWNKIRETTLKSSAPCFIHEEEGIIQKTIRDLFDYNIKEIIIQGNRAFQDAMKFMKDILPTESHKIKEYKNKIPIFTKFNVEEQISKLYQPIVSLPSGGYIVINPTEALTSIDVNSGKATSERNIEETALKTNLEAARDIARQIKLRNLYGLIVIDFIDMMEFKNRRIVERSLKEFLSRDRARIQVNAITSLGLLEMSRQRLRPSFLETNAAICSHCNGKGIVRADESNSMLILRTIENEIFDSSVDIINVYSHVSSILYLLNHKRRCIAFIEDKYNVKLNFFSDPNATIESYSIEKVILPKADVTESFKPLLQDTSEIYKQESKSSKPSKQKWNVSKPESVKTIETNDERHDTALKSDVNTPTPTSTFYKRKRKRSRNSNPAPSKS